MKAVKGIGATLLLAAALLGSAAPATAKPAAFRHYVACGLQSSAKPSHFCPKGARKGAFFRSNKADVFYKVCVKFPNGHSLCAPAQEAKQGTLYVNKITTNIPGRHKVTWYVKGKRVGSFFFHLPS
jgi:hypothetical protein